MRSQRARLSNAESIHHRCGVPRAGRLSFPTDLNFIITRTLLASSSSSSSSFSSSPETRVPIQRKELVKHSAPFLLRRQKALFLSESIPQQETRSWYIAEIPIDRSKVAPRNDRGPNGTVNSEMFRYRLVRYFVYISCLLIRNPREIYVAYYNYHK